jgi:hypothetical protein
LYFRFGIVDITTQDWYHLPSKLMEMDATVAPGLGSKLEQDNLCHD